MIQIGKKVIRRTQKFWNHCLFHPTDAVEDAWGKRILDRFAQRMRGTLPPPVKSMLEKKHSIINMKINPRICFTLPSNFSATRRNSPIF